MPSDQGACGFNPLIRSLGSLVSRRALHLRAGVENRCQHVLGWESENLNGAIQHRLLICALLGESFDIRNGRYRH